MNIRKHFYSAKEHLSWKLENIVKDRFVCRPPFLHPYSFSATLNMLKTFSPFLLPHEAKTNLSCVEVLTKTRTWCFWCFQVTNTTQQSAFVMSETSTERITCNYRNVQCSAASQFVAFWRSLMSPLLRKSLKFWFCVLRKNPSESIHDFLNLR